MKNNWSSRRFVLIYQFQVKTVDTKTFIENVKQSDYELNTYELNSDKGMRLSKECHAYVNSDIMKNNEAVAVELVSSELVVFESGIGFAVEHFQLNELDKNTITIDNLRKFASVERVKNTCKELENCEFFAGHSTKPIVFSCFTRESLFGATNYVNARDIDYTYRERDIINNLIGARGERRRGLIMQNYEGYFLDLYQDFAWDATAQGCCIIYNGQSDNNYSANGWGATVNLLFNTYVYTLHQMFYYERLRLLCKNTKQYKLRQFIRLLNTYHEQYIEFKTNYTLTQLNSEHEQYVMCEFLYRRLDVKTIELTLVKVFETVQKQTETAFEKVKNIVLAIIEGLTCATLIITVMQLVGADFGIPWGVIMGVSLGLGAIVTAVHLLSQYPIDRSSVAAFFRRFRRKNK